MKNHAGVELNEAEASLVECYAKLAALLQERREELPPFAERNALKALAALWQVMNGLDMEPGQVYDLGA